MNSKYDNRFWVLTCRECGRNYIIGVNANVVCWEEVYTVGKGSYQMENVVGKLQPNGEEKDLIINTGDYKPIPETLTDIDLHRHEKASSLLCQSIATGQNRHWDCRA